MELIVHAMQSNLRSEYRHFKVPFPPWPVPWQVFFSPTQAPHNRYQCVGARFEFDIHKEQTYLHLDDFIKSYSGFNTIQHAPPLPVSILYNKTLRGLGENNFAGGVNTQLTAYLPA